MMKGLSADLANHTTVQVLLTCTALAAGIFIVDVASLPLGVAAGVALHWRGAAFSVAARMAFFIYRRRRRIHSHDTWIPFI